ncbi:MAG: hypothetical protein QM730_22185 [Anaerolineales bacterium]
MDNQQINTVRPKRTFLWFGIVILVIAGGIIFLVRRNQPGNSNPGNNNLIPVAVDTNQALTGTPDKFGIDVQLSDGQPQPQNVTPLPAATGEPLSVDEIGAILSRLPGPVPGAGEQTEFNLPADVLPPPKPGNTIKESFPPLETEPTLVAEEAGPLQVLRFAPEGEIPIAPFISVTFNQSMVPLGTLSDLAAKDVPAVIEPALAGTWRWLGTKTLTFEYDSELIDRLPKATEFTVTVPAGTKSVTGGVLAEAVSWKFKTPPPKVVTTYPDNSPQPLEPLFFVAFDQRIDPAAVLKTISVKAGSRDVSIVLATQAEIDKDERVSQMSKDAQEGRWLAFRATEAFQTETNITVTIGPGTPSAEGPLTTTEAQSYNFLTYTPLQIVEHRCSWYDNECPPLTPFYIRFNNPLDTSVTSEDMLRVEPEIPGVTANIYGDSIEISGETKGRTTYTVTVSGKVQDIFGQQLGKDVRLTFKVGKAEPTLVNTQQVFMTLDPTTSKKIYSLYAINYAKLNLKVYSVQPDDWDAFQKYLQNWQQNDPALKMPGKLVEDKVLNLDLPADTLTQVDLDLGQYLSGKYGHLVLIVEPPAGMFESDNDKWRRYSQTIITWVQVTQIGLDAYSDYSQMVAWATDLKDGSPLAGVQIRPGNKSTTILSGVDGVARFEIPMGASYLVANKGADQAILPRSMYGWYGDYWNPFQVYDFLRWYVYDDRQMYKPGEEVHIKGWLQLIGARQNGDVGLAGDRLRTIDYQITDATGNAITNGQAEVNTAGGFDFAFKIPDVINLGTAQITFNVAGELRGMSGSDYYHQFQIQEFRRPEYEVNARNETTGPYFVGDKATLAVEAKYYAGGGLPNADVSWQVTTSSSTYSPPKWDEFTFGNWQPWWFYDYWYPPFPGGESQTDYFNGKTDASGTHYLNLDFQPQGDQSKDPQPQSIVAQATVTDVNRQAWSSTTTLLVHPADVYIGIRSDRYFVPKGTPLKIEFIVTDLDGNPVENRQVDITAGRLEWKTKNGTFVEEVVDEQTCSVLSKPEPDTCSFETPLGGSYQITAIVTNEHGRKNQSRFTRWVSGGKLPPARKVVQENVTLIPDKETYQPGDTAEILVQSPFTPAEGLLTVTRSGILYTTRFQVEDGTAVVKIPIEDKHIPNLNIQVDLVGSAPRTDDNGDLLKNVPPRPAFATAQLTLSIPPLQRTLSLQVTPDQSKLEPGGETTLTVLVKDAKNAPVADAELAVVVVDEAILALTNYQVQDPLSVFYENRPSYLDSVYGRTSIVLAERPQNIQAQERESSGGFLDFLSGAPAATQAPATEAPAQPAVANGNLRISQTPINVRSDFNPLATFAPTVHTGSNGEARIYVKLPDNLTRYRVMVVAVDKKG